MFLYYFLQRQKIEDVESAKNQVEVTVSGRFKEQDEAAEIVVISYL